MREKEIQTKWKKKKKGSLRNEHYGGQSRVHGVHHALDLAPIGGVGQERFRPFVVSWNHFLRSLFHFRCFWRFSCFLCFWRFLKELFV